MRIQTEPYDAADIKPVYPLDPKGQVMNKIRKFVSETAVENWDREGGVPISSQLWKQAWDFYIDVKRNVVGAPEPSIGPSGDGTVHFNFDIGISLRRIVIEMHPSGLYWSSRDLEGKDTYGSYATVATAIEELNKFFKV